MSKQKLVSLGREGFTLAEMLVAMALLAVLAAIVVPSILRQVGKGDATRVANDLRSISEAAQSYYSDKFAWSTGLDSLALASGTSPYLAIPQFATGDSIMTGGNGVIANDFEGDSVVLGTGVTYRLSDNVQLDAGATVGVTSAADRVNPFVGLSMRF